LRHGEIDGGAGIPCLDNDQGLIRPIDQGTAPGGRDRQA
jgi:hypothetical protein